ncbi:potassium transporter TrkA [Marinitoga sp. 1135]|uniref:K+ transport system, NAD-binding component n=1 Tax=Marinitoga piezophila (strain DSM 14283 / JCM 11233 / KA3) TaxID=443254 RepID=H2J634_MARPK|nr:MULTISPECIES: NAD(P)-binding protein [Marinitoga]AEX85095.1 K+ transport system, NAD-binding component [Marinitoga piezophila KA3]APT75600.1 potassium transporter TrkA [Marinitoga sp. 1137]NUU95309.1 potassium transporter TrkA [Marinitoga sp. 1135]NUU97243.1 potassium transporter TrkA [Marinitoga sp. 1138]
MKNKMKYIIIIGCGRLGSELARKFSKEHNVIVVDKDPEALERLKKYNFTGFSMVVDSSDIVILEQVKAEKADLIYIVTPDDNLNFMLANACNTLYKSKNANLQIIARVNDPQKKNLFEKAGLNIFCPIEHAVDELIGNEGVAL